MAVRVTLALAYSHLVASVNVAVPGCACTGHQQKPIHPNGTVTSMKGAYPATYGMTCAAHAEPASTACSFSNGSAKPATQQESWCMSPWCYVDPCTCNLAEAKSSSYFETPALYYSYANCGGQDTFTDKYNANSGVVSEANCPANFSIPQLCPTKMGNEAASFDCSSPWAPMGHSEWGVMGKCVSANVSGKQPMYPANYGVGCGIHPEPGYSACADENGILKPRAEQADWCNKPWAYVNPCDCTISDMARSNTFYPMLIFYSYAACGASDEFTTVQQKTEDIADARCPSPAPPSAPIQSPANWPRSKPVDQKCQCVKTGMPLVDCSSKKFAQGGKCVNTTKFPGPYPANYGESCGVHLDPLAADCFDLSNGLPWAAPCAGGLTSGCRKAWCDQPWCYVDPCTCDDPSIQDITHSNYFEKAGANLYYSYSNCKGQDSYTATPSALDRRAICPAGLNAECSHVKDLYKANSCCGNPTKKITTFTEGFNR